MHQLLGEQVHGGDTLLVYGDKRTLACVRSVSTGVYYVTACGMILAVCTTRRAALAAYHAGRP